jgi:hypothetical protein
MKHLYRCTEFQSFAGADLQPDRDHPSDLISNTIPPQALGISYRSNPLSLQKFG